RLAGVLDANGESFELLFVDDGCPQRSFELIEELAAEESRGAGTRLAANAGQHRAVLVGLAEARGRRIVVMDSDLQDPPEAIPSLLRRLDGGDRAAVFAGRRGRYESALRLVTSRLFKLTLHLLTGLPRDAGLFVAMDRRMRGRLLALRVRRPFVVA